LSRHACRSALLGAVILIDERDPSRLIYGIICPLWRRIFCLFHASRGPAWYDEHMITLIPIEQVDDAHGALIVDAFNRLFVLNGGESDDYGDGRGGEVHGDGWGYGIGRGDGVGDGVGTGRGYGLGNGNGWGNGYGYGGTTAPEGWRIK